MREQRQKETLTLELGDLKEKVSRKGNGRWGRGLQKNLKKVGVRVGPSLLPPCHCHCHFCCHGMVVVPVVVMAHCHLSWWLVVVGTRGWG